MTTRDINIVFFFFFGLIFFKKKWFPVFAFTISALTYILSQNLSRARLPYLKKLPVFAFTISALTYILSHNLSRAWSPYLKLCLLKTNAYKYL